ncbi:MAG: S41 family peptidase [Ferruginibacter sp.]|nr:S41 family peptidase [Ferruginibacter sp.]
MKKIATLFCMLFHLSCLAQTNVKPLLDSVLAKAKETSLYVSTINWDSLQQQVYAKAQQAKTIEDLKPAFETLLNGLRDHHGKIINAKNYSYIAWFTDNKNKRYKDDRFFDNKIWKVINDTALKFSYKFLKNKIGYLKIVGIGPNIDIEKESIKIRQAIILLTKQKVDKWIIDLRYNGGGNMHPMMAGIAPLVGNGVVGGLVNLKKEKLFSWEIKESNFIYGGYQAVTLPANPKFKKEPKIAVLTSKWTISSGEIVATALKGRPNTKFFGETTGGYTTNDGWDIINNEIILAISTGIYCDRNGNVYEKNIPVDVEIPFEVVNDIEKDNCIIAAKKWLLNK